MSKIRTNYIVKISPDKIPEVEINMLVEEELNEDENTDQIIANKLKTISLPALSQPSIFGIPKSSEQHEANLGSHVQPSADKRPQQPTAPARPSAGKPPHSNKPATTKQLSAVKKICAKTGVTEDELCKHFNISSLEALNNGQVQEVFEMQKQFKENRG